MKTIFAICIAVFVLCMNQQYPFSPIQFILLELFVIGLPSFFLALQPNTNPIRGKFMTNLAKNSLPAGLSLVASTIAIYIYQMFTGISPEALSTMASLAVIAVGFIALFSQCKPFNWFKSIMFVACIGICITGICLLYDKFGYVNIEKTEILFLITVVQACYPLYIVIHRLFDWSSKVASNE